jgi:hypothetical protein
MNKTMRNAKTIQFAGYVSRENLENLLAQTGHNEGQIEYIIEEADALMPGYISPKLRVFGDDPNGETYMVHMKP